MLIMRNKTKIQPIETTVYDINFSEHRFIIIFYFKSVHGLLLTLFKLISILGSQTNIKKILNMKLPFVFQCIFATNFKSIWCLSRSCLKLNLSQIFSYTWLVRRNINEMHFWYITETLRVCGSVCATASKK